MQSIETRGNTEDWTMDDENQYDAIDRNITRSMLSTANQCNLRKMHIKQWSPAIGLAKNANQYWDARIKHKADRNPTSGVLNYYNRALPFVECITQINQARQRLKYVVANTKEQRTHKEVQLATVIVEHKQPHFFEGNDHAPVKNVNLVTKVLKTRENRKTGSWNQSGIQIRGVLKPDTLKPSKIVKIEVPDGDRWRKVEDKEIMEEHLMERNIEQFSCTKKNHSPTRNWEPN
jgi:hypothetical protein